MIQISTEPVRNTPGDNLEDPVDHLMACHRRIEARLETLERAGAAWAERPAEAAEAAQRALAFMDTTARLHTEDEEHSLFPRLLPLMKPAELEFIHHLEREHQQADEALAQLRRVTALLADGEPVLDEYRRLAAHVRELYRNHIRREDETLTAIAKRVFGPEALAEIAAEMRERRANSRRKS